MSSTVAISCIVVWGLAVVASAALIPLFLWWFVGPVLVTSSRSMPMKVAVPTAVHQARRANLVAWALSSLWVLFLVSALD
jgi:hypothetical protein